MMNSKLMSSVQKVALVAVAMSTLGAIANPVRADEALIQETVQESYSTGVGNVSVQSSSQQNRQYRGTRGSRRYYEDRDNIGIVQRSQQLCDQLGDLNTCVQDSRQTNTSLRDRAYRSRGRYHRH